MQVEFLDRQSFPKSQPATILGGVAWNGRVVCHGSHCVLALPIHWISALVVVFRGGIPRLHCTTKLNLVRDVRACYLPRIAPRLSKVRYLHLYAILVNLLLEAATVIANAIPTSRHVQRCQRLQVAS